MDPEQNRRQTGWFQGKDGKWRFEIDDSGAKYIPGGGDRLGDILKHDALYKAYPELREMPVRVDNGMEILGVFDPNRNEIVYRSSDPYDEALDFDLYQGDDKDAIKVILRKLQYIKTLGALLHEVQHAIQYAEGFARGGNPNFGYVILFNQYFDEAIKQPGYQRLKTPKGRLNFIDRYIRVQNGGKSINSLKERTYSALYGEQEARSVENRQDLTAKERRESGPFVGDSDSIIANGEKQLSQYKKNLLETGLGADVVSEIIKITK